MRCVLIALALFVFADSCRANDIKEYVQYRTERLRTYSDAVAYHARTKGVVVVWVGIPDTDSTFESWKLSRDSAYHVFVDELDSTSKGTIIIARDYNGTFSQYYTLVFPDKQNVLSYLLLGANNVSDRVSQASTR